MNKMGEEKMQHWEVLDDDNGNGASDDDGISLKGSLTKNTG